MPIHCVTSKKRSTIKKGFAPYVKGSRNILTQRSPLRQFPFTLSKPLGTVQTAKMCKLICMVTGHDVCLSLSLSLSIYIYIYFFFFSGRSNFTCFWTITTIVIDFQVSFLVGYWMISLAPVCDCLTHQIVNYDIVTVSFRTCQDDTVHYSLILDIACSGDGSQKLFSNEKLYVWIIFILEISEKILPSVKGGSIGFLPGLQVSPLRIIVRLQNGEIVWEKTTTKKKKKTLDPIWKWGNRQFSFK